MEMIDTSINTFQRSILKMKSSSTFSQIKLVTLDIETTAEYGFPDVESAQEEILAITIQDYTTKQIITWGVNLLQISRKMSLIIIVILNTNF